VPIFASCTTDIFALSVERNVLPPPPGCLHLRQTLPYSAPTYWVVHLTVPNFASCMIDTCTLSFVPCDDCPCPPLSAYTSQTLLYSAPTC
jgi:hypothetical protein